MGQADARRARARGPGLVLMRERGARRGARPRAGSGRAACWSRAAPATMAAMAGRRRRLLARQGWPVAVAELAPPRPGSDAAVVRAEWRGPVVPFAPAEAARADLVIDAVFGAGFRGTLPDAVADLLAAAPRVLAVDVPSGLDGATGQARGRVRAADCTVTFVARKPGHLLLPGRSLCGELVLADIVMPDAALPPALARGATRRRSGRCRRQARAATNTPAATSPCWAGRR